MVADPEAVFTLLLALTFPFTECILDINNTSCNNTITRLRKKGDSSGLIYLLIKRKPNIFIEVVHLKIVFYYSLSLYSQDFTVFRN